MMGQAKKFESDFLCESYFCVTHECGLPIYVYPKQTSTVHALFAVNYGSAHNMPLEKKGKTPFPDGIAHFLEHKLFSNEDGSDSFEHFSALGADANAYTSHTRTVYLFSATDRVEEALAELVEFVTHPYFTAETVKKEQGIIGEEIRMCADNPYDRCYYNMLEGMYHNHPVRTEICGTVRSISRITAESLYDCYSTYYRPDRMALVVCGDVTVEQVMNAVNAHLPSYSPLTPLTLSQIQEPTTVRRSRVVDKGQVAKPIFSIGVKDIAIPAEPAARIKRDAGMAVLSEMLFSESGELYNRMLDARMISPDFSADYAITENFGFLQISGEANDPERVLEEIVTYLAELRQNGLSVKDFERCRRVELAEYVKGFDSAEEIAGMMVSFIFDEAEPFSYGDILKNMEFSFVESLFAEFFDPARFTLSVVNPKRQEQKGEKDE